MLKYGPDVRNSVLNADAREFTPSLKKDAIDTKALYSESDFPGSPTYTNATLFEDEMHGCNAEHTLKLLEHMTKEDLIHMMQKYIHAHRETPLTKACEQPIDGNERWIIRFAEKMGFNFFYTPNPCLAERWESFGTSPWQLLQVTNPELYTNLREMEAAAKSKMRP